MRYLGDRNKGNQSVCWRVYPLSIVHAFTILFGKKIQLNSLKLQFFCV